MISKVILVIKNNLIVFEENHQGIIKKKDEELESGRAELDDSNKKIQDLESELESGRAELEDSNKKIKDLESELESANNDYGE